jgi:hypothetical protein
MKGIVRLFLFFALLYPLFADDASAQLLRRRVQPQCQNGQCQIEFVAPSVVEQPVQILPVEQKAEQTGTGWFAKLTGPRGKSLSESEKGVIRSWGKRAVRIINGNSCGTGSLCGRDTQFIYILTNAHVASTRIGNIVRCEALLADESGTEKFSAVVIESAYSSKTSTDWALLKAEVKYMKDIAPIQLSTTMPDDGVLTGTWGCPRCEVPSGQWLETTSKSSIWMWNPNSIGGQSGSAVVQAGQQKGLLTWTINGYGAGQFTSAIYKQSRERNTDGGARPNGLVPVVGLSANVELEEGFHAETGIGDYPIWSTSPGDQPTPPTVEPDADDPDEKRLLDKLRDLRRKNQSLDWVALINLIMQIIDLIAKSKGN